MLTLKATLTMELHCTVSRERICSCKLFICKTLKILTWPCNKLSSKHCSNKPNRETGVQSALVDCKTSSRRHMRRHILPILTRTSMRSISSKMPQRIRVVLFQELLLASCSFLSRFWSESLIDNFLRNVEEGGDEWGLQDKLIKTWPTVIRRGNESKDPTGKSISTLLQVAVSAQNGNRISFSNSRRIRKLLAKNFPRKSEDETWSLEKSSKMTLNVWRYDFGSK